MSGISLRRLGCSVLSICKLESTPALALGASALGGRPILLRCGLWSRSFATEKKEDANAAASGVPADEEKPGPSAEGDVGAADTSAGTEPSPQELIAQMKVKEEQAAKLTQQVESLTDSLKRTLADMENLRARTAREVDVSKKFAIQGFVKALLDVPDNLERAAGVVPPEALKEDGGLPVEKLRSLLSGLLEGVRATESIMMKVLKQHGVERYDPTGQAFDPNLHNALFDVPDPSKENNTIAIVTKKGYKLNDRVVRPAEVGVVRNVTQ
ncbi:Mitochondrial matrix cochaperone [Pleodorina starrii]|uniref:GrpE protein homolog n=1 Tax=Pleodorina starrii TaxID=330485 RepID=A0A9W6BM85_9CHLO|nr:Mitochondrial matrix cochaperone [Pleodorina starrii]GLC72031.1 Mitochondrial matrix cochaperone [Pleodorina starrii]